jgi:hypothetical protein
MNTYRIELHDSQQAERLPNTKQAQARFLASINRHGKWTRHAYRNGGGWIGTAWTEEYFLDGQWSHTIVGGANGPRPDVYYNTELYVLIG